MSNTFINIIGILILIWAVWMIIRRIMTPHREKAVKKRIRETRDSAKKTDAQLFGRRFEVERDDKAPVRVNIYEYDTDHKAPMIFLFHGGTLLDGDADQMDSFCNRMKEQWEADIISINYSKLDEHHVPYPQEEIVDSVKYFAIHSADIHGNSDKIAFIGFSGGAYVMTGAAALLGQIGLKIKGMIAFYPLLDDSIIRLADSHLIPCPVTLVTCNNEEMNRRCGIYAQHLEQAGVTTEIKEYPDAVQGFIEYNNPEFLENPKYKNNLKSFDDDQKAMANACEIWLGGEFEGFFEEENA